MNFQPSDYSYGSDDASSSGSQDLFAAVVAKIVDPDPHFRAAKLRNRIQTLENLLANNPGSPLRGVWQHDLNRSREMLTAAERASGVQVSEEGIVTAGKAATWSVALVGSAAALYFVSQAVRPWWEKS